MKLPKLRTTLVSAVATCGLVLSVSGLVRAELADISPVPLANNPTSPVLPNLMYILDDSGSMAWDHMPDNVRDIAAGPVMSNCKTVNTAVAPAVPVVNVSAVTCSPSSPSTSGDPPYYAAQFNQIYYNPDITYSAGVTSTGLSMGDSNPKAAIDDTYLNPLNAKTGLPVTPLRDLTANYAEAYYCNTTTPTAAQLADTTVCKRNGIDNVGGSFNYFIYWSNNATAGTVLGAYPVATTDPTTSFNKRVVSNTAAPYYFTITPQEYCSDTDLINCQLANADGSAPSGYTIPAPIRYCKTAAQASAATAVSDPVNTAAPQCRKKFDQTNYQYPRYGRFSRTNIVPGTATYPKSATAVRTDCAAAASCTYAEELQNFANWYSYYRTRLMMMKSATGHAFIPIDDRYRVGFITINPNNPVSAFVSGGKSNASAKYLQINTFNAPQKSDWYTILYGQTTNGGTPLREALSRVGRHYAGQTDGINNGMNTDPIQYSCQQNFSLLTTDGYWNNNGETVGPVQIDGKTNVGNTDNVIDTVNTPPFVDRSTTGTLDALGASVTSSTPTTIVEQMVCTGNSKTTFGGNTGTQVTCGCGKGSTSGQVIERTMVQTSSVTTGEGIVGAPITGVTYTFKTINATCAPPLTTQTVTPGVYVDFATCKTASKKTSCTATFADTSTATANCAAGLQVILAKEIVSATQTVTQVAGSTTSSTVSGTGPNTYYFYNNGTGYYLNGAPNSSNVAVTSVACTASALTLPTPSAQFIATGSAVTTTTSSPIMPTLQSPNPATPVAGVTTFTSVAGGTPDTLADVAMYYYKTDLRPTGPVSQGNVPGTTKDFYNEQHMSTFTLGLGLQGNMTYTSTYETNPLSDYGKIKSAANGCVWSGAGTCDWPAPVMATPSTLDDLWHAAVNGRGVYYSASDPNTLADGLAGALAALKIQTAAASASATSSPNITQTDNFIYSSTFRTVKWDGEISARRLDPATGNVLPAIVWSADAQLNAQVSLASDTRTIWTFSGGLPTKLKPFLFANLTATAVAPKVAEQSFFVNQCGALSQCPLLNATQKAAANDGNNLVNYLRGQKGNEGTLFRLRDNVLGDSVNAVPAFVRNPNAGFLDVVTPNYQKFQSDNASRQAVLYVAANDGMLHAFNGDTGSELWAFIPRFVFPQMAKLATDTWDVQHRYLVDGSPQTGDVFDTTASAWKSIIVGGLNSGGSGFYALDVTDPANPKGLWQFCNDSTICTTFDANMGLSYGNPVITKRKFDGKWVVLITSGINNAPPNAPSGDGTGWLWVLDAITGVVLDKVSTKTGSVATPAGFAKISAFADSFNTDNTSLWVYGGDLLGNLWRFDMSVSPPTAFLMATLKDGAGNPQSITTRPELGLINSNRVVFVGTGRYIGLNDLPDPSTEKPPLPWAYQQSLYAIKDNNTAYGDPRKKLIQQTLIDKSGTTRTTSTNKVDFTVDNGWYVDFNPGNTTPGERVNIDPQLVLGTLVVQTNIPNNNACTVGGDSFLYQFDYASGQYVSTATGQVVAQKTYGQIAVGNAIVRTTTGVIKAEQSFSGGQPPVSTGIYIGSSKGLGRRVSWRELLQ